MAQTSGRSHRRTSSAVTSRETDLDSLIAKLLDQLQHHNDRVSYADFLAQIPAVANSLSRELVGKDVNRDIFRRAKGFEAVLKALDSEPNSSSVGGWDAHLIASLLSLLSTALGEHRGNGKYFSVHVDGWAKLERLLERVLVYCPADNTKHHADCYSAVLDGLWHMSTGRRSVVQLATTNEEISGETAAGNYSFTQKTIPNDDTVLTIPIACAIAVRLATSSLLTVEMPHLHAAATHLIVLTAEAVKFSVRNAIALWRCGTLSDLTSAAYVQKTGHSGHEPANMLTSTLAQFGFPSVEEVAKQFKLAQDSDETRELLLTTLRQSKEPAHVRFDMTYTGYSSIEFPCMMRTFPPPTGYTLSVWLRIDRFDRDSHTTIFGAFDATQTCFNLVYLEKDSHQLILQTSIKATRPSVRFKSSKFTTNLWYHLVITHTKNSMDTQQSSAALFVDGVFKEQVKCNYPEAPPYYEEIASSGTAVSQLSNSRRQRPVQAFVGTPRDLRARDGRNQVMSQWSLASARLYHTPVTDEYVAVQYHLGPRYIGNMQDCLGPLLTYSASAELNRYNELLHPDKSEGSDIITATEGRGSNLVAESKLLISIFPSAIVNFDYSNALEPVIRGMLDSKAHLRYHQLSQQAGSVALNCAVPTFSEAFSRSHGSGILTGNPVIVEPNSLDNAVWSVVGSVAIFTRFLESATTRAGFLLAIKIVFESIRDNWRISEAMEKGKGFDMISVIIKDKLGFDLGTSNSRKPASALPLPDRSEMAKELLQLVLEFVGYVKDKPEASMIVNPMAYRVLLLDFDTWRSCNLETQIMYYGQFVQFVSDNRHQAFNYKRLARMRTVKRLIEALKSEDFSEDVLPHVANALRALLDNHASGPLFRDLAMFISFGLQDARAMILNPPRSFGSIVSIRQKAAKWAKSAHSSRSSTPSNEPAPQWKLSRADLATHMLRLLHGLITDENSSNTIRRFYKAVPNRWILHLLSEPDSTIVVHSLEILTRMLLVLGSEFKASFIDKNGGFTTLKSRLKSYWRLPAVWIACFSILLSRPSISQSSEASFTVFSLVSAFSVSDATEVRNPEIMPTIMSLLEAGLRSIVQVDDPVPSEVAILKTVIQFLNELYSRSALFRDFAVNSRYVQEILFVLFPILVGSDRLSAGTELYSDKSSLSFEGQDVKMRPHSNSLGERPPSIRSLNIESEVRTSSPRPTTRLPAPRRLSSFILVRQSENTGNVDHAQFNAVMAPKNSTGVAINVGNSIVETLLEVVTNLFIDQVCTKDRFAGIGLFLKVPPGFREHQAYFESYVLVHALTQLWNHLKLDQSLLLETRVLTNLSRFCVHMAEAVFEGWFIDGAQPLLDFSGKLVEYLQQPEIAAVKDVRLCSQNINAIRIVFLRVCLWRLSELDEMQAEEDTTAFLDKMNYWQTILFSSENQETLFLRLICFLLFIKLTSDPRPVRLAAVRLWRTIMVYKPTETATLLTFVMGSEQRHLSTGFMKLISMDDDEFLKWVDESKSSLEKLFISALNKPWEDFVTEENRQTEESASNRLSKRKDRLRQWQIEENTADDFLHRYEISTNHWRSNIHAQERLKLQRSIQDFQQNISHLWTVFAAIDRLITQPCGLEPSTNLIKWQLDETEAVNRMRVRMLPSSADPTEVYRPKRKASTLKPNGNLAINTQIEQTIKDNILSPMPGSPTVVDGDGAQDEANTLRGRGRSDSVSNSQLLEGGFEMVEDPREADDGILEDKNRKVMTSLQRGDVVQHLYNISRIIGLEACEGLLILGKKCIYMQDNFFQRSDGEIVSVGQAPDDERDPYVQLISGKDVGGRRTKNSAGDQETRHWTWVEVLSISKRRFLFRDVSIEVFFTDGRSYLLTCISSKVRDDLYAAIVNKAPHVHGSSTATSEDAWRLDTLRNPEEAPQSFGSKFASVFNAAPSHVATKKWAKGEMSNFQYLMLVNTMAGRTFNDLTQYPVFPWVLADYSSDELDLTNPKTFRDLSRPMGCQTRAREAEYRDRFKQFADMGDHNSPPFHYGTHYSSAMIVTSYLIRLEPFVQSYLLLQGGSFDHADRLFDSIEHAWFSASRDNMTDVRELTPEFFYLPEFLLNINKYDFGVKQASGEVVNDVKLPPWAKNDPHIFVAKHREALESPYVSQHLHEWVDLVFGYKQRGEAAIEATNVFQHLSYQGARDLDSINDPVERLASIGIIHSFGQTPHQVFQKPHAARDHMRSAASRLDTLTETLFKVSEPLFESDERVANLTYSPMNERLLCTGPCRLNLLPNSDRYMQWGYTDNSLRFHTSGTKRQLGHYEHIHIGPITTAIFPDSKTLVTAGMDCTIGLWGISSSRDSVVLQPKTYLFGHRKSVVILTASRVYSTLLSASSDGNVLLWSLNRYQSISVLRQAGEPMIQAARISNVSGHILLCQDQHLILYTLNGHMLLKQKVCETDADRLTSCAFYEGAGNEWLDRELIFTGHTHGVVNVWTLTTLSDGTWYLLLVKRLAHMESGNGPAATAAITAILPMPHAVYTGDGDGRVWEWNCVSHHGNFGSRGR